MVLVVLQNSSCFPSHPVSYEPNPIEGENKKKLLDSFPVLSSATNILAAAGSLALKIEGLTSKDADEVIDMFELSQSSDMADIVRDLISPNPQKEKLETFAVVRWIGESPVGRTQPNCRLIIFGPLRAQQNIVSFSNAILATLKFLRSSSPEKTFRFYYKLFRPGDVCTVLNCGERSAKRTSSVALSLGSHSQLISLDFVIREGNEIRLNSSFPHIVLECSSSAAERLFVRVVLDAFDTTRMERPKVCND